MKKMSIKYKLFFSFSILIFLSVFSITVITQSFMGEAFRQNTLKDHQRELTLITNSLQSNLSHVADYEMSVALDDTVISTLEEHPVITGPAEYNEIRRRLGLKVNSIIGMNQTIFQWDIVLLDHTFLNASGYELLKPIEKALGANYFSEANATRGITLNGPFMVEKLGESNETIPVFVMSKQIVNLDTLKTLGYVAFFITESSLASTFEDNMPADAKLDYFMISRDEKVLSSSQKETIGKDFAATQNIPAQAVEELNRQGSYTAGYGRDSILYTATPMGQNDWTVIYVTPLATLMASQYKVRGMVFVIGGIACALSLLIAGIIAYRITHPIVALSEKMSSYYKEEPEKAVTFASNDEIENLYAGFDDLIRNTQRLMEQIYSEQEEKSDYKFQLIQAQIKPHFLYNTLETIKSLVDIGLNDEASEAIMAMSKFYRMSLNDGNDTTTVANEVELSRQYLCIQKLRYTEYLEYEIHECGGLDRYMIPKLTLQPLLENAIYHGIKPKQNNGHIVLTVSEKENRLIFVIEDNGVGMNAITLDALKKSLTYEDKTKITAFGLYSINRRMQLFFGSAYTLKLESGEGEYTRVTLTVPKQTQGSDMSKKRIEAGGDTLC